ncbi:unannotated protein [freshwater metagenome]|uniref:Unannotated protein n=1 Tax=freshwater metagenome TaxID=449393 RepID=A0A6J6BSU7_9ZZZZ
MSDSENADSALTPEIVDQGPEEGVAGFDFGSMMEMAQNMQQQAVEAQQQLASTQLVGSAGGGVVSVTLNGHLHLVGLRIDPAAVDAEDLSILEDLIRAAWQDAYDQVAQLQAQVDPMAGMGDIGDLLGGL